MRHHIVRVIKSDINACMRHALRLAIDVQTDLHSGPEIDWNIAPLYQPKVLSSKAGEVWRVGLACLLYTTPYACMCIDFNRLHRISTPVRLFASTDRVELSSTLRLHTQVSHFAQNIAKSPSDQPWASSTPHASLWAPGFSTFLKTLSTSLVTVDPTVTTLKRLQSSISTQCSSYGPMKWLRRKQSIEP